MDWTGVRDVTCTPYAAFAGVEPHDERADPVLFRITYHPHLHLEPELIEADEVRIEGESSIVLRRTIMVIGSPRPIVARRLRACDVAAVDEATT